MKFMLDPVYLSLSVTVKTCLQREEEQVARDRAIE